MDNFYNNNLLLLKYFKQLDINEKQVVIIQIIENFFNQQKNITSKKLSEFMSIPEKEIDDEINDLLEKDFLVLNKKNILEVKNIYSNILKIVNQDKEVKNVSDYEFIENKLNIKLTNEQKITISIFKEKNISSEDIKKLIIDKNVISFKNLLDELIKLDNETNSNIIIYDWLSD